ncbi:MAG: alanine dehydrogenase, partial [Burkholderiales bacterium]
VCVQSGAGRRVGFDDADYALAGARIVESATEVYACPMIVKVKEPQMEECALLNEGQLLFAYLHLAAGPTLAAALIERRIVGIAYETVTDARGTRPLLTPMSEVAGRLAIQFGAWSLQMANGGNGTLLSGVPGVPPARVLILGAGVVGTHAAKAAVGAGADVTIMDIDVTRLRYLEDVFGARLKTCYSQPQAIEDASARADLVVASVLIPGKRAPKILSRSTVRAMHPGSVLVDVAIDQGGCADTSHPTTHSAPIYVEEGVVHSCVTNMPAACARTSMLALTNATLPYVLGLADKGYASALREDRGLRDGLQLYFGNVTHAVAQDLGLPYIDPHQALGI